MAWTRVFQFLLLGGPASRRSQTICDDRPAQGPEARTDEPRAAASGTPPRTAVTPDPSARHLALDQLPGLKSGFEQRVDAVEFRTPRFESPA